MVILSSLQQYAQTQKGIQNGIFEHLKTNAIILTDDFIGKEVDFAIFFFKLLVNCPMSSTGLSIE